MLFAVISCWSINFNIMWRLLNSHSVSTSLITGYFFVAAKPTPIIGLGRLELCFRSSYRSSRPRKLMRQKNPADLQKFCWLSSRETVGVYSNPVASHYREGNLWRGAPQTRKQLARYRFDRTFAARTTTTLVNSGQPNTSTYPNNTAIKAAKKSRK